MAPVVLDTGLPHDACAVTFTPDEGAPMRHPPAPTLTVPWRPLALSASVHSTLQAHEFPDTETFLAAFGEVKALGYEVLDDHVERVHAADFLLGTQISATAAGLEGRPHLHDVARSRGVARPELRARLTLRRGEGGWPFLDGTLRSVSVMIDAGDRRSRRVSVDITAL
ncbi:hypothetical protein [uncultured Deinococcus sp.]|uniref:hypothetical protein n=1 Tax=uncultured Deinococcus sp. TaxID=158789 RepID=UPI0025ED4A67|nr:hypothetical protein [uncultured Deinococcus sp.]